MRNLRAGVPIKFIQLVGGWSSIAVLEGYVRAMESEDAVEAELRLIISELKGSMFLTGCRNIEELAGAGKVITGITATWFEGLGGMG